jgi:hypothetical protein
VSLADGIVLAPVDVRLRSELNARRSVLIRVTYAARGVRTESGNVIPLLGNGLVPPSEQASTLAVVEGRVESVTPSSVVLQIGDRRVAVLLSSIMQVRTV